MKFSSFFSLAFVSIAAASPVANKVEKRLDLTPVTDPVSSEVSGTVARVARAAGSTSDTVDTIVGDVGSLLSSLISDVEGVASAAGVALSDISDGFVSKRDKLRADLERRDDVEGVASAAGVALSDISDGFVSKRDKLRADLERRDVDAVVTAVTKLITNLLGSVETLAGDSDISLVGTLPSILNI